MAAKYVRNVHVGLIKVSQHAMDRWDERGSQANTLDDSVKAAVPFGAQRGTGDTLLIHDEIVFAVRRAGRKHVMTTVLSKDFAVANIEASLGHTVFRGEKAPKREPVPLTEILDDAKFGLVQEAPPGMPKVTTPNSAKKQKQSSGEKAIFAQMIALYEMTDVQLAEAMKNTEGQWSHIMQRELGHRNRLKKMSAHAARRVESHDQLKKAIRDVLPEGLIQELWKKTAEIREANQEKAP